MFSRSSTNSKESAGGGVSLAEGIGAAAHGAANWLCLAAAPTFAIMALLTALSGGSDMLCMAVPDALPLDGMTLMYLLMSAFHLAPWLKLAASQNRVR